MNIEPINLLNHNDLKGRLFDLLMRFSVERREVVLACGEKSNIYIDCRQVYFLGEAQFIIGELFFKNMLKLEANSPSFSACGGMAMGSIPLSCALSAAAFRRGRELPGFAVRKETKDHGMLATIEGDKCLASNQRVLMVEDVITTGSSSLAAIAKLRERGMLVDTLFAIVDRKQGGRENLMKASVQLSALFTLNDFT